MDKLSEIMAHQREEVEKRRRPVRSAELERLARLPRSGPSLAEALRRTDGRLAVVAEVKRRSPSAGSIAPRVEAADQARRYYNAGAEAISVLTNERYFGGTIRDLWEVNDLLQGRPDTPPTLRKDFFLDPIQIVEAAEAGARAILLIVRALDDTLLRELREAADQAGLDSLFEIHEEPELERALAAGARLIGVNNRDLSTFRTDLAVSERLIPKFPSTITAVSESGIVTLDDAARAKAAGAHAILVGEALMRAPDPEELIAQFHQL